MSISPPTEPSQFPLESAAAKAESPIPSIMAMAQNNAIIFFIFKYPPFLNGNRNLRKAYAFVAALIVEIIISYFFL